MLMKAIVEATLLYASESWTVTKADERRINAFEMKIYRRLLGVTWKEKKTNQWVKEEITRQCGYAPKKIMESVKERKLKYYGHTVRRGRLGRLIIEGQMDGKRGRGRPMDKWEDNLKKWSGLKMDDLRKNAKDRNVWRKCVASYVHRRP